MKGAFHQSFQKIRGEKRKLDKSEIQEYIQERKRLKFEIENTPNVVAQNRFQYVEEKIATLISNKNRSRVMQVLQNISNSDNSCNTLGMWKQIKK